MAETRGWGKGNDASRWSGFRRRSLGCILLCLSSNRDVERLKREGALPSRERRGCSSSASLVFVSLYVRSYFAYSNILENTRIIKRLSIK